MENLESTETGDLDPNDFNLLALKFDDGDYDKLCLAEKCDLRLNGLHEIIINTDTNNKKF